MMITNVFLVGKISDKISEYARLIEIERSYKNSKGVFESDIIPAIYWSKNNSAFMKMRNGSCVCIKGRLEKDSIIGVHIVIEELTLFGNNNFE